ncbi:MAG: hypothetical protein AMS16_06485 [Planctomycetes bacterium DG_58]|nr:MAG: hypothetical protein AMS16_06485 [Planctomycetes bacterium DG_58]
MIRRRKRPAAAAAFIILVVLWGTSAGWTVLAELTPALPTGILPSKPGHPNVLLIVLDTVRADHMSCYGYHRRTTPRVDAFAAKARVYKDVLSPSCWTLPSHASFFTGLPVSAHGVTWTHQALDRQFDTLAEQLQGAGYQTVGLSSNPILTASRFFDQGFELYEVAGPRSTRTLSARLVARIVKPVAWRGSAPQMHRRLGRWFRSDYTPDKPFFIFLNYIEPHQPYLPASHLLEWSTPELVDKWEKVNQGDALFQYTLTGLDTLSSTDIEELAALYDEEIAYVDRHVGELLDFLRTNGLDKNTLVIITSDHGEHFGEHHMMDHQYSLYEPLVRVPLIVKWDDRLPPGEDETPVQSHDLYPTVLEAARIDWKKTSAHNCESLLRKSGGVARRGFAEYLAPLLCFITENSNRYPRLDFGRFLRQLRAVQLGSMKLIRYSDGSVELFDLARDPIELRDLSSDRPAVVMKLQQTLDRWLQSFQHYEPLVPTPEALEKLSPEELDAMRGLGYLR